MLKNHRAIINRNLNLRKELIMEWYWWVVLVIGILAIPLKVKFLKNYKKRNEKNNEDEWDD